MRCRENSCRSAVASCRCESGAKFHREWSRTIYCQDHVQNHHCGERFLFSSAARRAKKVASNISGCICRTNRFEDMAKMRSQVRHDIDRVVAEIKFVEAQLGSRVSFLTINQLLILSFFNRVCFRQSHIHKETDFFPLQVPTRPEKNSEYIPVQHGKRWRWNHSASSTNVRRVGIYRTSRKGQEKCSFPYFPPQSRQTTTIQRN